MDTKKYRNAAMKALNLLISNMDDNAIYTDEQVKDELSCLYKLPTQLLLWGRQDIANKVFDHIAKNVQQPNGDFYGHPEKEGWERKCGNPTLAYNWPYINGWLCRSSHRGGRFDISVPGYKYMKTYYNPVQRGFLWAQPYNPDADSLEQSLCAYMCGHLGYSFLFFGELTIARDTGDTLIRFMDIQPSLDEEFLLKMDTSGKLVTSGWPEDRKLLFRIKRNEQPNFFYQLGFPAIFLSKLYMATGEKRYLEGAKRYIDFAMSCGEPMYAFNKSHKVAMAAAIVAGITKEDKYGTLAKRIADNILSTCDEEGWFLSTCPVLERYDQTVENSGWFREISVELDKYLRK